MFSTTLPDLITSRRNFRLLLVCLGLNLGTMALAQVPAQQAALVYSLIQTGRAVEYSSYTHLGDASPTGSNVVTGTTQLKSFMIIDQRSGLHQIAFVDYYTGTVPDESQTTVPRGVQKLYEVRQADLRPLPTSADFDTALGSGEWGFLHVLNNHPTTPTAARWSISRPYHDASTTEVWSLQGPAAAKVKISTVPLVEIALAPTMLAGRWQDAKVTESGSIAWNGNQVAKTTTVLQSVGTHKALLDITLTKEVHSGSTNLTGAIGKVTAKLDSLGYNPVPTSN